MTWRSIDGVGKLAFVHKETVNEPICIRIIEVYSTNVCGNRKRQMEF
jgi:hypothetical protein